MHTYRNGGVPIAAWFLGHMILLSLTGNTADVISDFSGRTVGKHSKRVDFAF